MSLVIEGVRSHTTQLGGFLSQTILTESSKLEVFLQFHSHSDTHMSLQEMLSREDPLTIPIISVCGGALLLLLI